MERKKILIPGGKYSDLALVNAAHRLGLYVITAGTHTDAPAHKFADEYVCLDYSDKDAMLQLAKDKKIDYMCTCANDFGMLSTAYVCEKLGLPGHDSYETTLTIHNKDRFKPLAKQLGLHAPISEVFTDKETALEYAKNCGKKIIIKPVDNVASIGVSQPNTPEEMEAAIDLAFSKSKIKTILIEPFIEGYFTTVTSMIINQEVVAFFADSAFFYPEGEVVGDEFPMNLRCNGGIQPSPYMEDWTPYIIEDFNKLAKELKLADGKFHAEILVNPETHEAQIFDVHRRMSGFAEPLPEWDYCTSLMWEDWVVMAECGMDLYDRIINPDLLVRRVTITANNVISETDAKKIVKNEQIDLFTDVDKMLHDEQLENEKEEKEKNLQQAILSIKKKYGKNAVLKGMNFKEGATMIDRNGQIGGHKA